MMTIGITGGTGFVGRHITQLLLSKGYEVIIFTRNPGKYAPSGNLHYALWNPVANSIDVNDLKKLNGIIHLAGEGVADKRWTAKRKREIVESRVKGTSFLVEQLLQHAPDCKVFVGSSAIGIYGPNRGGSPFTEESAPGNDFLANTCVQWEAASNEVVPQMRRVLLRTGIVLGKEAGAFPEFEKPVRFGILPMLGGGSQIISWIHIDDLVAMFVYALEHEEMTGIYNAVAPAPVSQKLLMYTIAHIKNRLPIGIPIPAFALKFALGEMSTEVLKSTTVSANKISDTGYEFTYPTIATAVKQLVSKVT